MQEAQVLNENMDRFTRIGFEIEPFGGEEYAVRAIPDNLFGIAKKELLLEMLDDLTDGISTCLLYTSRQTIHVGEETNEEDRRDFN